MFRSPLYHPYHRPSAPSPSSGFRTGDVIKMRGCFNLFRKLDFTDARSPDPSPLTSPVEDTPDEDAPPTGLSDFQRRLFSSPQRPSAPTPDGRRNAMPNAVPARGLPPQCRKHRRAKQPAIQQERSGFIPPHRRSHQPKEKREAIRDRFREHGGRRMHYGPDALASLRNQAEILMRPEHMNDEDRIFLTQLRNLQLDNELEHELQQCRRRVARAASEADQRRKAHAARDAEAERLWQEERNEDVPEDQKSSAESSPQRENETQEAYFRRLEEEGMRADEKRQRAYQAGERMIREYQEQCFYDEMAHKAEEERRRREQARIAAEEQRRRREEEERRLREEKERREREEMERRQREYERKKREELERERQAQRERQQREEERRKAQEEIERIRRESEERHLREQKERLEKEIREQQAQEHAARLEHERLLRETRERLVREEQERLRAEQERRAIEEEQICRYFAIYEAKWNELRTSTSLPLIDVEEMPWPVFGVATCPDQITAQVVKMFLFHPLRPGVEGKTARDKVKSEVLRFHPDKFNARIVPKIKPAQQEIAQEIAGAVARILTTLMTEDVEQQN